MRTEKERHELDAIYHKKAIGETLTPDEVDVVIAFERESAIHQADEEKKHELWENESQAKIAETRRTAQMMREALLDKCNAEKMKFERFLKDEPQQK